MTEEELFEAARHIGDAVKRNAYLDRACASDAALRQRVEALLRSHSRAADFLEQPAADLGATGDEAPGNWIDPADLARPIEGPGSRIGPYKLLQSLGEGGMGAVFLAEQERPVKRRVALKVIKAGMDSARVIARFEAERQALALMDHPNIAKVLDAGTTDSGRPYFVMELVKGIPITKFCDQEHLTPKERLELFHPVCQAVQHAHQKGIIHRDLKPSNVLIALYDGRPVPKVIDFGVAKAMGQKLTEETMFTEVGQIVGTLEYMAPEQAELNNLDIDTRADIYSLGVLLYELLTGGPPFTAKQLRSAVLTEMLRLIREVEPAKPSTKLSSSEELPAIAAKRKLEPAKLTKLVRGELDWIVMKCLEKDRGRRYETANGLARDVERYLSDELVEARPPTARYRLRKFLGKHRVAISTAAAFAALLIVSAGVSIAFAMKAREAKDDAENKRIEAETNEEKARSLSDQLWKSIEQNIQARYRTEIQSAGLEVDLALGETRHRIEAVGLLQLVRFLTKKPIVVEYPFDVTLGSGKTTATVKTTTSIDVGPEFDRLRQFATMAVLASAQSFAPLLPPITHDGAQILASSFNSKGDRLLTIGADKTARLWDPFTGRQIAVLRRADEKVICAGFSLDGASSFTHSLDGVVRLWDTKEGTYRAETASRKERLKFLGFDSITPFDNPKFASEFASEQRYPLTQLSNDRLITSSEVWGAADNFIGYGVKSRGPAELWDAKTGRFIARLEQSEIGDRTWKFFGNGRWIAAHEGSWTIGVWSAENGRPIAKIKHPGKKYITVTTTPIVSPNGRTAATVAYYDIVCDVYWWDTTSWQLSSITGPVDGQPDNRFTFISDEFFAVRTVPDNHDRGIIYRTGSATPITQLPSLPNLIQGDRVLCSAGELFDTRTWRRLQPAKGRKYHPEIARFAPDGRFLPLMHAAYDPRAFIDTATEKTFLLREDQRYFYQPKAGWVTGNAVGWDPEIAWVMGYDGPSPAKLTRLPPPEHLVIPPDLLELWAQVAVRGQLDDEGTFVKWDEPTWEKKQQELAAKPAPSPDFPFPGHVATDRLHWLRQEYKNASDAEKPRLAKQLLDRAEAAGDRAEAVRWRAILTPKPSPTKPATKP